MLLIGGLLFARRVAETMSRRVTRMDHTQGVAAHALDWGTLRNILLPWVATLPLAAGIAWLTLRIF